MRAASWLLYSGIIGYCDLYNNGEVGDTISNRRAYFSDCGIANVIFDSVTVSKDVARSTGGAGSRFDSIPIYAVGSRFPYTTKTHK
ncbi:MAG: hypothetical protein PHV18_13405 [Lachnospiraceae bacterium]|nr:hypothetical protein [Lachnospiraceae bacterium]